MTESSWSEFVDDRFSKTDSRQKSLRDGFVRMGEKGLDEYEP